MLNHGKVFIIDESELIDGLGQNTLLKTLEEPPPATYIILVTSEPDRLLPTIHSRCQHVRFARLDEAAMGRWFAQRGLALDKPERAWIETFAEGSPGEALRAAEYGFFAWQTTLAPMLAAVSQGRFPPEMGAAMAEMIEQFAQAWVKKHKSASKDAANKDGASHVFSLLAAHARRELRRAVESGEAEAAERAAAAIDLIRAAETHLDSNVNPRLAMDNLVAQWAEADAQTAMS
jgi:DNA polymerase-3 subunit delta'